MTVPNLSPSQVFPFLRHLLMLSGIALVTLALAHQMENRYYPHFAFAVVFVFVFVAIIFLARSQMVLYGGLFGLGASLSAMCNFLASHGLRTWRRALLLPWLLFFLLVLGLLTATMVRDLWCHRVQWRHVLLFVANLLIFSCWRHMQRQFLLMSLPRPEGLSSQDVEAVLREVQEVREVLQPLPLHKDCPPKYEEVEGEDPPRYDEITMGGRLQA